MGKHLAIGLLVAVGVFGLTAAAVAEEPVVSRHQSRSTIRCDTWQPQLVPCSWGGLNFVVYAGHAGDDQQVDDWLTYGPTPVVDEAGWRQLEETCGPDDAECWWSLAEEIAVGWAVIRLFTDETTGTSLDEVPYLLYWYGTEAQRWWVSLSEPLAIETGGPAFTVEGTTPRKDRVRMRDILDDEVIPWFQQQYGWLPAGPFTVSANTEDESGERESECFVQERTIVLNLTWCLTTGVLAHEYVHLIQYAGAHQPSWFAEGSAIRLTHEFENAQGDGPEALPFWHPSQLLTEFSCDAPQEAMFRGPLRDSPEHEHYRGTLAVEWLAFLSSEQAVIDFIDAYPNILRWESVFEETFGFSYDAFMTFWDGYQAAYVAQYVDTCGEPDLGSEEAEERG